MIVQTPHPFAMLKVDQGAGDVEWVRVDRIDSVQGYEDSLQFIHLSSGRKVEALGSVAEFLGRMNEALADGDGW